jgi:hypothetical protein
MKNIKIFNLILLFFSCIMFYNCQSEKEIQIKHVYSSYRASGKSYRIDSIEIINSSKELIDSIVTQRTTYVDRKVEKVLQKQKLIPENNILFFATGKLNIPYFIWENKNIVQFETSDDSIRRYLKGSILLNHEFHLFLRRGNIKKSVIKDTSVIHLKKDFREFIL